jgi:hypothetical protein
MDQIIKYVVGEIRVIAGAPATFVTALLVLAVAIWWAMDWKYSGIIVNRDSEITLYKSQRDDYKDKLNGATPDQAKKQLEDLQRRVDILAKHIDPRSLTADQERVLKQVATVAREAGNVIHISGDVACTDCSIYGNEFARILDDAGWKVITGISMGPNRHPPTGLGLSVGDPQNPTLAESKLINALRAAGVPFDLLDRSGNGEPQMLIRPPAPH